MDHGNHMLHVGVNLNKNNWFCFYRGIPFKTPSAIHGHNGPDNIKVSTFYNDLYP